MPQRMDQRIHLRMSKGSLFRKNLCLALALALNQGNEAQKLQVQLKTRLEFKRSISNSDYILGLSIPGLCNIFIIYWLKGSFSLNRPEQAQRCSGNIFFAGVNFGTERFFVGNGKNIIQYALPSCQGQIFYGLNQATICDSCIVLFVSL